MPGYDPARAAEIRPRLTLRHHSDPQPYDNGQLRRLAAVAFPADAGDYWLTAKGLTPAAKGLVADLYAADDLACRRDEEVRRRANADTRISPSASARTAEPWHHTRGPLMPTLTPAEKAKLDRPRLEKLVEEVAAGAKDRPGHAARLVARSLTVAPPEMVAQVAEALRAQAVLEAENKVAAQAILAAIVDAVAVAMPTPAVPLPAPEQEPTPSWGQRLPRFTLIRPESRR